MQHSAGEVGGLELELVRLMWLYVLLMYNTLTVPSLTCNRKHVFSDGWVGLSNSLTPAAHGGRYQAFGTGEIPMPG